MKEPENVAALLKAMKYSVNIPVTIKCRLGVDDFDSYDFIKSFVETISIQGEITTFIVHARKALLKVLLNKLLNLVKGLNPHENRTVPPLHYDWVIKLAKEFPHLDFIINGGFKNAPDV